MEATPFFSVVIPIYNVEDYLKKAIDSVLSQTFSDYEIILVNDCSPDNCADICSEYCKKYNNIKYIKHSQNMGISETRNTGFESVKGKYVWFMDSDDYIEPDLFNDVFKSLQQNDADAVVFGCTEDYYNSNSELYNSIVLKPEKAFCNNLSEIRKKVIDLELGTFYGYVWNKFFSVDMIRKYSLQYKNVVLIEDIDFNIRFFNNINRLNILDIASYHYAKRGKNSLTSKFVPDYYKVHRQRIEMLYEQQKLWDNDTPSVKSALSGIYARYIFSALSRNCDKRAEMNHSGRVNWLKSVFTDSLFINLIDYAKPDGFFLKVMVHFLRKKSVFMCLSGARIIYFVQKNLQPVFVKVKQQRT